MKIKNLILTLAASAAYCASPQAFASFDDISCSWNSNCPMSGVPYLAADNDTRINLLMLAAAQKKFPLLLSSTGKDLSRNRDYDFSLYRNQTSNEDEQQGQATSADTSGQQANNSLKILASSLGIDSAALSNATPENEGRKVSNNLDSLSQFFTALQADRQLTPENRHLLASWRSQIYLNEEGSAQFLPLLQNTPSDSSVSAFRDYLANAELFYQGKFSQAEAGFSTLLSSQQKWVAQTADYMLFRIALNQITVNAIDEYGMFDPQRVNKDAGAAALQRAQAYLTTYPDGLYAASVRGFHRRIYWYLSDWLQLASLYESNISTSSDINTLGTMIDESDRILLSREIPYQSKEQPFISAAGTPLLTFTQNMKWLRKYNLEKESVPKLTEEALQNERPMFADAHQLPLWEYMHNTWLFYQQKDYAALVADITPAAMLSPDDILAFSQQIIYGNALAMLNKWQEAQSHWRHLLSLPLNEYQQQYVQLMLTTTLVQQNKTSEIYAAESPINNLRYRSLVLKSLADKALLQQQASSAPTDEEKTIALHTLLFKDLMVGDYQGFIDDKRLQQNIKNMPDQKLFDDVNIGVFNWDGSGSEPGYFCAPLDKTVEVLAKNKNDPHASNCIGEFLRTTNANVRIDVESGNNGKLDQLASTALNQDPMHGRLKYYQQVIADPKAEPEDKSYALYRAVMCFSPSGYNSCDQQEIAKQTRQRWFNQLKSNYKGNQWAQRLKYYW